MPSCQCDRCFAEPSDDRCGEWQTCSSCRMVLCGECWGTPAKDGDVCNGCCEWRTDGTGMGEDESMPRRLSVADRFVEMVANGTMPDGTPIDVGLMGIAIGVLSEIRGVCTPSQGPERC